MIDIKTMANRLYIFQVHRYTNSSTDFHDKENRKVIQALND